MKTIRQWLAAIKRWLEAREEKRIDAWTKEAQRQLGMAEFPDYKIDKRLERKVSAWIKEGDRQVAVAKQVREVQDYLDARWEAQEQEKGL